MGQNCCCFEDWSHLTIEDSFEVSKDSPISFACCPSKKEFVKRDPERGGRVKNIDLLFDDVDKTLAVSF